MKKLSEEAIRIVNELHTERLDYNAEYVPLINALNKFAECEERETPKKINYDVPSHVKAFDGEDKIETYACYPCPNCGKWIVANPSHKYCSHCGQRLDWSSVQ